MKRAIKVIDETEDLGWRSDFELRDPRGGGRTTWKALRDAARKETGTRRPQVEVILRLAKDNKWIGQPQEFGLDAQAALRVGRKLVESGEVDSAWVDARYHRTFSQRGITTHALYRVEVVEPDRNPEQERYYLKRTIDSQGGLEQWVVMDRRTGMAATRAMAKVEAKDELDRLRGQRASNPRRQRELATRLARGG